MLTLVFCIVKRKIVLSRDMVVNFDVRAEVICYYDKLDCVRILGRLESKVTCNAIHRSKKDGACRF